MNIKKHIPNLLTLGNLFCGTVATIFAVKNQLNIAALFVVIGILFDFLDGFVARLLKVSGELGKQLDSLADMVTSGVVPGIFMYQLVLQSQQFTAVGSFDTSNTQSTNFLAYLGLLLTLAACYRLANFNIDSRQSDAFIGIPTPAMTLFIISLPLISAHTQFLFVIDILKNTYVLIAITLILSYLMNANIVLFALKFKSFKWKENGMKYVFLTVSLLLLATLHFVAIPLIIVLYVLVSLINNLIKE